MASGVPLEQTKGETADLEASPLLHLLFQQKAKADHHHHPVAKAYHQPMHSKGPKAHMPAKAAYHHPHPQPKAPLFPAKAWPMKADAHKGGHY